MEIVEKYIHNKFIEWNIRFIGLADNADTDVVGNKKSRQINGLVNEWYLEDVSNNIRSAFQAKMKQGEFISPFAAFGYIVSEKDNNKIIIDPDAAEIVKEIYDLYLKGLGFTGIAKYLNSKHIPSPALYKHLKGIKLNIISNRPIEEIKWSTNAIKTILSNELYIGNLIQGKRTTISYKNHKLRFKKKNEWIRIENTHDPIINKEIFNKVQIAIKERKKSSKKTGLAHNFSGKVFCLECQRYMKKKNSKNYSYLVCSNNRDGYDDCINKKSIRYDKLENIILNAINNQIYKYYDEEYLTNIREKNMNNRFINKISLLEQQKINISKKVVETKKYLKKLYEDKVNGLISIDQFKALANDYNSNELLYNERIKSIEIEINSYRKKYKNLTNHKKIFSKYKLLKALNRIIIEEFIEKIYISKLDEEKNTRTIKIKWNFNL